MQPFTRNLRLRADELGISLAEAARRAGLSERRFGNYATGRREPDLATLVRIAETLGTTPDRLLSVGEAAIAEGVAGDDPGERERERLRGRIRAATHGLSTDDLDRVTIMIEALAGRRGG